MDTETDGLCLLLLLQFLLWGCDDFQTGDYEEAVYHLCFRDGCNWEGVEMSFQISIWGGGWKDFQSFLCSLGEPSHGVLADSPGERRILKHNPSWLLKGFSIPVIN